MTPRCACGAPLKVYWIWASEERDDMLHVTDRWRDAPKGAEEVQAASHTDAAIAYDKKHEAEHDINGPRGPLRKGRCARRLLKR